jgi:hypothetical protein
MGRYRQEYRRSLTEPDRYWRAAAGLIDWYTEPAAPVTNVTDPPGAPIRMTVSGLLVHVGARRRPERRVLAVAERAGRLLFRPGMRGQPLDPLRPP